MANIMYTIEKPQESVNAELAANLSESSNSSSQSTEQFPCVSCLDDTILPPQRKLPDTVAMKLSNAGWALAIVSLVFTLAVTGFAFFISNESDSSATFGFAFDSFFALVSSCILIWRFSSKTRESYTVAKRETNATAIVAICMVVSAVVVFVRAIYCLYRTNKPQKPIELLILTTISFSIYSILFFAKYSVAQKLGSGCLMTDAIDSFCAAIFALSILISAIVLKFTTKVWYLDSTIAIIVSICSFIYGLVVIEKLIRVFRKREEIARHEYERLLSQKEAKDEGSPLPHNAAKNW